MNLWHDPELVFVQKAFFLGLFSGELILEGAYYWKEFCVSKWVGLGNKNCLKHYENSLKQLALKVYGLIFGSAYYWKNFCVCDLGGGGGGGGPIFGRAYLFIYLFILFYFILFFLGGDLIIGILRYLESA